MYVLSHESAKLKQLGKTHNNNQGGNLDSSNVRFKDSDSSHNGHISNIYEKILILKSVSNPDNRMKKYLYSLHFNARVVKKFKYYS